MTVDPIHAPDTTLPNLLTLAQTAEVLQISTKTLYRWIEAGDLITHRIGHQLRISEADLQMFIRIRRDA